MSDKVKLNVVPLNAGTTENKVSDICESVKTADMLLTISHEEGQMRIKYSKGDNALEVIGVLEQAKSVLLEMLWK